MRALLLYLNGSIQETVWDEKYPEIILHVPVPPPPDLPFTTESATPPYSPMLSRHFHFVAVAHLPGVAVFQQTEGPL